VLLDTARVSQHAEITQFISSQPLSAKASGNIVNLTIVKDAWFEVGKTIFEISDPTIGIVSATVTAPREAIVEFNSDQLQGKKIQFEMKSLFYYHAGEAIIE
jgi:hypothetical protein